MAEVKDQLVTMEVLKYSQDTLNKKIDTFSSISDTTLTIGSSNVSRCILNVGGVRRLLIFNSDGTVTWQSV